MLDVLRIVRGAVAERDLLPVLTHFYINAGVIQGSDGRIAISAPFEDADVRGLVVPADKFLRAADVCAGMPRMKMNEDGTRLRMSKGAMRVTMPVLPPDSYPVMPDCEGEVLSVAGEFLSVLRQLQPFMGTDAVRIWSCGVYFDGAHAYATNNIALVRVPFEFPCVMLPTFAVEELLRISLPPQTVQVGENTARLDLGSGVRLQTQLYAAKGPDLGAFFDDWPATLPALPADTAKKVRTLTPFCESGFVRFSAAGVHTRNGKEAVSADIEDTEFPDAVFTLQYLVPVLEAATHFDMTPAPNACAFSGPGGFQGRMVGARNTENADA